MFKVDLMPECKLQAILVRESRSWSTRTAGQLLGVQHLYRHKTDTSTKYCPTTSGLGVRDRIPGQLRIWDWFYYYYYFYYFLKYLKQTMFRICNWRLSNRIIHIQCYHNCCCRMQSLCHIVLVSPRLLLSFQTERDKNIRNMYRDMIWYKSGLDAQKKGF